MLCKHGTPPQRKDGARRFTVCRPPDRKSFRGALVPDLAITHARVIPEHASHVREREPVAASKRCSAARLPGSGVTPLPAVRGREARAAINFPLGQKPDAMFGVEVRARSAGRACPVPCCFPPLTPNGSRGENSAARPIFGYHRQRKSVAERRVALPP